MIDRYSTTEMKQNWGLENKFANYLKVELAVIKAYGKLKIIDNATVDKILNNAKFSLEKILEYETITKHDVIAFIQSVSENLGSEKIWFHYGLTSSDVIDTAFALQMQAANKILFIKIEQFLDTLRKIALKYKNLPSVGRTHGIHAEITSFGLKWLGYYDEIRRELVWFKEAAKEIETGKISGAIGNFANIPVEVQDLVCKDLNLNSADFSTQIISRDRYAYYLSIVALIASTLEKIALEVRTLNRTEIGEVSEQFLAKQKGSSAMPHKRNPVVSENITGISRLLRSYIVPALENNILWSERDISHSSVERVIFPDSTNLLDYALTRYQNLLENITIDEQQIKENINYTKGLIFSQQILNALINKGMLRNEAYELIHKLSLKAFIDQADFLEVLSKNAEILKHLTAEELKELFDWKKFLINVDKIYKKVLKNYA